MVAVLGQGVSRPARSQFYRTPGSTPSHPGTPPTAVHHRTLTGCLASTSAPQPTHTPRCTARGCSSSSSRNTTLRMWHWQGPPAKHRSHSSLHGYPHGVHAAAVPSGHGDKGADPQERDQPVVITATAIAPSLPAATAGSAPSTLHHLHHAGSGASGAAPLGAGGAAGSVGPPPSGQPYYRLTASQHASQGAGSQPSTSVLVPPLGPPAANASSCSLDEDMLRAAAASSARRGALCDSGLPDPDMCDLVLESGPPATTPVVAEALSRGRWLLGLLIVQSTSSFVLDAYQDLLRDHLVVTLFLTMLVGAGGNAGNQSAIKVIRGLATGVIRPSWPSARATMREQALVGLMLGTGLSAGGFVRVYATHGDLANAAAISVSLFTIVLTSVVLGTGLPFVLARAGVDPANAGTSIQVLMDILGVAITCVTCNFVLVQLAQGVAAAGVS